MPTVSENLRHGARMLLKSPVFTVTALLALTLGIGANSAIFSVLQTVLLNPLPYDEPHNLVWIWAQNLRQDFDKAAVSPPDFVDYRQRSRSFQHLSAARFVTANLTGSGDPEQLKAAAVTTNFFDMLRVKPVAGRTFLPEEEQAGQQEVAVLSQGLWQRRFGSDPEMIGKPLTLNGRPRLVVGVVPSKLEVFDEVEVWLPISFEGYGWLDRSEHFLRVIGRLQPGVGRAQAQSELNTIASQLAKAYPESNTGWDVQIIPLREYLVGDSRRALLFLATAAGLVLLIACANVANLLLAKATVRHKEIAIRSALGAGRGQILQQLLTESVMLSLLGGVLGLLLAAGGMRVLTHLASREIPRIDQIGINLPVLLFTLAISLLTGLVFGLAPSLQASKTDLVGTLKEGGRAGAGGAGGQRARSLLVVAEVALAVFLLIGAGLLMKSFLRLLNLDPGFDPKGVLAVHLGISSTDYAEDHQVASFYQQALARLRTQPGVQAVGVISHLPLSDQEEDTSFTIAGRPVPQRPEEMNYTNVRVVAGDYFRAMEIPLVSGRLLDERDHADAPHTVLINDTLARLFFPDENPLGKRITLALDEPYEAEIVGIVGSVRHSSLIDEPLQDTYLSHLQVPYRRMNIVLRSGQAPATLAPAVRREIWQIDRNQAIPEMVTMEQLVDKALAGRRFSLFLLGLFAVIALTLSLVGIYGVIAYSVSQRHHEIGLRMALGAQRSNVLGLVLSQGFRVVLVGIVLGLIGAFALSRFVSSLLFDITATDPATFIGVAVLLALIALLAIFVPARKAAQVDPMVALRDEVA